MRKVLDYIKNFVGYLAELMKKYGQATVVNCVLLVLLTVCIMTIVDFKINEIMPEQFRKNKKDDQIEHRDSFNRSREFYADLKTFLRQQRHDINCSYILLLEYHNGSENVATNIQFCKFDITMDIQDPKETQLDVDDYVNENIYKYDILLGDNGLDKFNTLTIDKLEEVDNMFYRLVTAYNNNVGYVVLADVDVDGHSVGKLVFLFNEGKCEVDMVKIINCVSKVEKKMKIGI